MPPKKTNISAQLLECPDCLEEKRLSRHQVPGGQIRPQNYKDYPLLPFLLLGLSYDIEPKKNGLTERRKSTNRIHRIPYSGKDFLISLSTVFVMSSFPSMTNIYEKSVGKSLCRLFHHLRPSHCLLLVE